MNAINQAPTPYPFPFAAIDPQKRPRSTPPLLISGSGQAALQEKREQWATLNLRQHFADESFMRAHLKSAGLIVKSSAEPATVTRLKALLRKAGVNGPEIASSIGGSIAQYLGLNPMLPLWAALALLLESTGRFTPREYILE
jgi:hypothetical protein